MADNGVANTPERLGAWVYYAAQLSFTWWQASEAARDVIGNPMFDYNTSIKILDKYKEINNGKTNNTGPL
jgi:hypothetical protein